MLIRCHSRGRREDEFLERNHLDETVFDCAVDLSFDPVDHFFLNSVVSQFVPEPHLGMLRYVVQVTDGARVVQK